jgi:hypothetical protein
VINKRDSGQPLHCHYFLPGPPYIALYCHLLPSTHTHEIPTKKCCSTQTTFNHSHAVCYPLGLHRAYRHVNLVSYLGIQAGPQELVDRSVPPCVSACSSASSCGACTPALCQQCEVRMAPAFGFPLDLTFLQGGDVIPICC